MTTMQTAEQLENGQFVLSGALDVPGHYRVPRASGQFLVGTGGVADIGGYLGTTGYTFNSGALARVYLNEWLKLGVQGNFIGSLHRRNDWNDLANVTVQLTGTRRDHLSYLYGGLAVGATHEFDRRHNATRTIAVGGLFGAETRLTDVINLQSEVNLYLLHWEQWDRGESFKRYRGGGGFLGIGSIPAQTMQFAIGLNYGAHRKAALPTGNTRYP
jgi:hypothetical protein